MKFLKWCALVLGLLLMATTAAAQETRGQRAELRFLEGMIDHHQMALDMANDCLAKTEDSVLLTLCYDIIEAQSGEITQMQAWLLEWYNVDYAPVSMLSSIESTASADPHAGHNMGGAETPNTDPAMMMGMMAGLNRLEGAAYDTAWIESMIDHHDDALHMAERILERAEHEDLIALAQQIISDQTAEIEQMEAMLAG